MRGENIEELCYGFWLIKAVVSLSFVFVVVLLFKRFYAVFLGIVLSGIRRNTRGCIRLAPCRQLGKLPISILATLRGALDERL
jgi:hypothetical protein